MQWVVRPIAFMAETGIIPPLGPNVLTTLSFTQE